jgi:hypothetical protein
MPSGTLPVGVRLCILSFFPTHLPSFLLSFLPSFIFTSSSFPRCFLFFVCLDLDVPIFAGCLRQQEAVPLWVAFAVLYLAFLVLLLLFGGRWSATMTTVKAVVSLYQVPALYLLLECNFRLVSRACFSCQVSCINVSPMSFTSQVFTSVPSYPLPSRISGVFTAMVGAAKLALLNLLPALSADCLVDHHVPVPLVTV